MIDLIVFLSLLALGYGAGTWAEKRHYRSILEREQQTINLPAVTLKSVGVPEHKIRSVQLVYGSAVISVDYFKRMLAGLRNIFGGKIKSYESLLDRARREALLRMKDMAGDATVIVNVRIETSAIGKQSNRSNIGCLEAMAYGTALTLEK
ncbi:YbjQ family protein [Desulfosarcina sp.]|uniref:YbjQ family protein n=1 Tax=Desulfosarcina sp. TaxID=2027861 RepID=UPI0039710671